MRILPETFYKRRAKELHRAVQAGDNDAVDRVAPVYNPATLTHSQALDIIARESGFKNWGDLHHQGAFYKQPKALAR